jgi:hypothetical protein
MTKVITDPNQITPEWLTGVLYQSGAMTGGKVETVTVQTGDSFTANLAYLTVGYSADADKNLLKKLILKTGKPYNG